MPRSTKPIFVWRGYTWTEAFDYSLEIRLKRIKKEIIKLANLKEKSEISALINDLSVALHRAWCVFREINHAGSDAVLYATLTAFTKDKKLLLENFRTCHASARNLIALHYPEGWMTLESAEPEPDLLFIAAEQALASIERPKAGGSPVNFAERLLAIELAEAYERHVKKPTRYVNPKTHKESGNYHKFVKLIFSIIPRRILIKKKGNISRIDFAVRLGVEHINTKKKKS